jgi:hypothetical protein
MVTILADATSLDPKDVIAPIGAVCGAAIAAFTAWFNARKTATDRLQALIAIYKDWPEGVTGRRHVAGLVRGQLGEIWHRYPHLDIEAAMKDDAPEIAAAAKRHLRSDWVAFVLSFLAVAASVGLLLRINEDQDVWLVVISLIGGSATFVAFSRGLRIVRHYLL